MAITISIIVPVYNVEPFLRGCIDSLLNQDLDTSCYEIILIDDGSTDSSGAICDKYAREHCCVHVLHQQNKGLGAARNTGIAAASGKYIQFVDSDDYLCPNVLGEIVHKLENQGLDILRFNYQNVTKGGVVFEPNKYSKPFDDYSKEVCDGSSFLNERLGFACYAWQFACRASLLKQEGNGFKEGILYEDVDWTPRILLQAKRVASCQTMVYNYLYRQNSISRNSDIEKKSKSIEDKLQLIKTMNDLGTTIKNNHWFYGMIAQTTLSILSEVSQYFFQDKKQYIRRLKVLHVFPLSSFHSTPSARKKIWLANISPSLLCFINHYKSSI